MAGVEDANLVVTVANPLAIAVVNSTKLKHVASSLSPLHHLAHSAGLLVVELVVKVQEVATLRMVRALNVQMALDPRK
jgi:hypothetical protein